LSTLCTLLYKSIFIVRVTRCKLCSLSLYFRPRFLTLGPTLGACCSHRMLTTDASLTCWGAVLDGRPTQGICRGCHLDWNINCLKLIAVFLTLKYFLWQLRGYHVLVRVYNTAVVAYINPHGRLRSRHLNKQVEQVPVPQGDLHSQKHECGSRSIVQTGGHTWGLEAPSRCSQSDLGKILRCNVPCTTC